MTKSFLSRLLVAGHSAVCVLVAAFAVAGALGFASPVLDLFNHLQVLWLAILVPLGLVVPIIRPPGRLRVLLSTIVFLGATASAVVVVPETLAGFGFRPAPPTDGRPVYRLMTHNLFGRNYDMKRVAAEILRENPDIVAVQEYFDEQRHRLGPLLAKAYPYSLACGGGRRAFVALFSKLPFTTSPDEECVTDGGKSERVARIIAQFKGRDGVPFTVVTTHLDWPYPISRQTSEFDTLSGAIAKINGPLILAGDFNSTSWSYALRSFASKADLTRQTRGLVTFPARFFVFGWRDTVPFLPLDHIMTRGGITVHELHRGAPTGSDHLPVIIDFSVSPRNASSQ